MTRIPKFGQSKTNVRPRTALRFALIACAIMSIMVLSFGSSANDRTNPTIKIKVDNASLSPASNQTGLLARLLSFLSAPKPPSGDLDQIRNGSFDAPLADPNWVNGNAGSSNAHYREGESIPYRLRLDNLSTTGTHTVIIEWDTRHSSVNAIDFITYYDRLSDSNPNPLKGLNAGSYTLKPPIAIPTPADTDAADFFDNLPAAERTFTVYNASNVVLSYDNEDPLDAGEAQTSSSLKIEFHADAPNVLFVWGGHIASRLDWGSTNGVPNSAGGISGSPYHTRFLELDGSGGNQDRSLSAAAVLPPAGCGIQPIGAVCGGAETTYSSPGTQAGATYDWSITGNGAFLVGGSEVTTNQTTSTVVVRAGASGSYTLNLTTNGAGFSSQSCSLQVTVNAVPVAGIVADVSACTNSPTLTANAVGGDQAGDTYLWSTGETTKTISPTTTGNYTVVITRNGCASAPANGNLCFVFN